MKRVEEDRKVSPLGMLVVALLFAVSIGMFLIPNNQVWEMYDVDRYAAANSLGVARMISLEADTNEVYVKTAQWLVKLLPRQAENKALVKDPISEKFAPFEENAKRNLSFAGWYALEHGLAVLMWWPLCAVLALVSVVCGCLDRRIRQWDSPVCIPSKWPGRLIEASVVLMAMTVVAPLSICVWAVPPVMALAATGTALWLRQLH